MGSERETEPGFLTQLPGPTGAEFPWPFPGFRGSLAEGREHRSPVNPKMMFQTLAQPRCRSGPEGGLHLFQTSVRVVFEHRTQKQLQRSGLSVPEPAPARWADAFVRSGP